jgi:hypothetical protein
MHTLLVSERSRRVDILWRVLTAAFAVALVRGHIGAGTATGRTVADLVFGALLVIAVAAWIWFRRHPARLEIVRLTPVWRGFGLGVLRAGTAIKKLAGGVRVVVCDPAPLPDADI